MSQCLLPYRVEVVKDADEMTARAGLVLVVEAIRALGLPRSIQREVRLQKRRGKFTDAAKIEDLMLLLASGGDCLDDIKVLQADGGFCRLLGRAVSSAETLRQHLNKYHDDRLIEEAMQRRPEGQKAYVPEETAALAGLGRVNVDLVRRVAAQSRCTTATLDHDATIQESHKQQALPHYKGGRGYQPSAIYWMEQDLAVADEYRDGNVPAGMNNLPLIRRGFAALPETVTARYFRADSACYDDAVLKWLSDEGRENGPRGAIGFTVSADMTEALRAVCAALPEEQWKQVEDRAEETVVCADVEFAPGDWPKEARPLRYVAVRIRKKQGLLFGGGYDTKYLAVVSNRRELPAVELLRWHWKKAGTIELLHDVTKNELGAAVPPSKRFGANAAWYRLSLMTYNLLSAMKTLALPGYLSEARPKRLRYTVFTLAGRLVSHAGCLVLRIAEASERLAGLIAARTKLALVARALASA